MKVNCLGLCGCKIFWCFFKLNGCVYTQYMRRTAGYTWDRLQNKCTNCKGFKNNTNFGQITGIQEKMDITCK